MEIKDLLGLGETGKVLIEKFSSAVGILWEPNQIKRISKAEAEASVESERIRAIGRLQNLEMLTDFQKRGLLRNIQENGVQQENLEKILLGAPNYLGDNAKPEELDTDWMRNFSEKAKMTSDKEMQNIWSRILAGEATKPGSFSKRTINKVNELERQDAEIFTKLCGFCINKDSPVLLIFKLDDSIYSGNGIYFSTLKHLDSMGLISFESLAGYQLTGLSKKVSVNYFGKNILMELPKESENEIEIGSVMLTNIGKELARICNPVKVEGFDSYIIQHWRQSGINIIV